MYFQKNVFENISYTNSYKYFSESACPTHTFQKDYLFYYLQQIVDVANKSF